MIFSYSILQASKSIDSRKEMHNIHDIDLADNDWEILSTGAMYLGLEEGDSLTTQGIPSPYMFYLVEGELQLVRTKMGCSGTEINYCCVIKPGSFFGILDIFTESFAAFGTISVASSRATLYRFHVPFLFQYFQCEPSVGMQWYNMIGKYFVTLLHYMDTTFLNQNTSDDVLDLPSLSSAPCKLANPIKIDSPTRQPINEPLPGSPVRMGLPAEDAPSELSTITKSPPKSSPLEQTTTTKSQPRSITKNAAPSAPTEQSTMAKSPPRGSIPTEESIMAKSPPKSHPLAKKDKVEAESKQMDNMLLERAIQSGISHSKKKPSPVDHYLNSGLNTSMDVSLSEMPVFHHHFHQHSNAITQHREQTLVPAPKSSLRESLSPKVKREKENLISSQRLTVKRESADLRKELKHERERQEKEKESPKNKPTNKEREDSESSQSEDAGPKDQKFVRTLPIDDKVISLIHSWNHVRDKTKGISPGPFKELFPYLLTQHLIYECEIQLLGLRSKKCQLYITNEYLCFNIITSKNSFSVIIIYLFEKYIFLINSKIRLTN